MNLAPKGVLYRKPVPFKERVLWALRATFLPWRGIRGFTLLETTGLHRMVYVKGWILPDGTWVVTSRQEVEE